jgi:SAM-dependent methyltransferase
VIQKTNEKSSGSEVWPKHRPALSEEQQRVFSDWYQYWLSKEGMQGRYSFVDRFGHKYAARTFEMGCKTLDIGAGNGAHLAYEDLDAQEYTALEQSPELIGDLRRRYPRARPVLGDCQRKMEFADNYFDRVLAIHVLEHLDNLPATLGEVHRTLHPGGRFSVVIPCEGGMLYNIGRKFSSESMFVKRYHQSYDWLIKYDHINNAREVMRELKSLFRIRRSQYFPFAIPFIDLQLVIGLTCIPLK